MREDLEGRILYKTKVNRGLAAEWVEVFDSWFDGKTRNDVSRLVQDSRRRRELFTRLVLSLMTDERRLRQQKRSIARRMMGPVTIDITYSGGHHLSEKQ